MPLPSVSLALMSHDRRRQLPSSSSSVSVGLLFPWSTLQLLTTMSWSLLVHPHCLKCHTVFLNWKRCTVEYSDRKRWTLKLRLKPHVLNVLLPVGLPGRSCGCLPACLPSSLLPCLDTDSISSTLPSGTASYLLRDDSAAQARGSVVSRMDTGIGRWHCLHP